MRMAPIISSHPFLYCVPKVIEARDANGSGEEDDDDDDNNSDDDEDDDNDNDDVPIWTHVD